MTALHDSLARVVESYETLVRDLMEAEGEALDLLYAVLDVGQLLDQRADHDAHGLVVEQGHQLVGALFGHRSPSLRLSEYSRSIAYLCMRVAAHRIP